MSEEKKYEISIDPRILELLGPSLYTNIYYILAELIANAYDANASNVYVIQDDDSIVVEDDGSGMSYEEGDVNKYLNVAQETRVDPDDAYVKGSKNSRKKMGRKGVGKLAALSVSKNVEIHTIKNGEKSGFILSRHVNENHLLEPIPDERVEFRQITQNGTAVVMREPQYDLHKRSDTIANNLLKLFPLVDESFRIHIHLGKQKPKIVDSFEKQIIKDLGGLITLGTQFEYLIEHFNSQLKNRSAVEDQLLKKNEAHIIPINMNDREGNKQSHNLTIEGWIGVYRSSRGRKADKKDFPDNFLSLMSNKKLGEFNILDTVGKNALAEVYVVGQLHIDLLEETTLPDIALSNRQGYKTDDIRYQKVTDYVRDDLLPKIIALRTKYASLFKAQKDEDKNQKAAAREALLRQKVDTFKDKASSSAVKKIAESLTDNIHFDSETAQSAIKQAINTNMPDLGIKSAIDDAKRKILLSHTSKDKAAADFIYHLLLHNNVPASHIIYTSSDNEESRIPETIPGTDIFEYLRKFFVESYSTQKIHVIYVTSEDMAESWAAVSEVGAGWITQQNHDIINVNSFTPKKPLDVSAVWASLNQDKSQIQIEALEADIIAAKIIKICKYLEYTTKTKDQILDEIKRIADIT
ncbi:ATP-binding protein [Kordiimonas aquimaris]|uniref:ATP-binding protein n=1 Tax=Kordiimonas aquimaris TaxID=707591 RepID=UPI0021D33760|nr:ATP-binding protein [Kordiimonas aquimaris]